MLLLSIILVGADALSKQRQEYFASQNGTAIPIYVGRRGFPIDLVTHAQDFVPRIFRYSGGEEEEWFHLFPIDILGRMYNITERNARVIPRGIYNLRKYNFNPYIIKPEPNCVGAHCNQISLFLCNDFLAHRAIPEEQSIELILPLKLLHFVPLQETHLFKFLKEHFKLNPRKSTVTVGSFTRHHSCEVIVNYGLFQVRIIYPTRYGPSGLGVKRKPCKLTDYFTRLGKFFDDITYSEQGDCYMELNKMQAGESQAISGSLAASICDVYRDTNPYLRAAKELDLSI